MRSRRTCPWSILSAALATLIIAGCAATQKTVQETPQQTYVREMGRTCNLLDPRYRLEQVAPDGRYWILTPGWGAGDSGSVNYFACMNEQFRAHPFGEWLKAQKREPS